MAAHVEAYAFNQVLAVAQFLRHTGRRGEAMSMGRHAAVNHNVCVGERLAAMVLNIQDPGVYAVDLHRRGLAGNGHFEMSGGRHFFGC